MSRRRIGQESIGFGDVSNTRHSPLDDWAALIDWVPIEQCFADISSAAKGEPAWPPLALFKAMLLAVWYDLSDVKLAEALDDRSSFRRFCGFSAVEATPEQTAFVRFRKALVARGLDKVLFDAITAQLREKAVRVKAGTLVDVTIIASASEDDGECAGGISPRRPYISASPPSPTTSSEHGLSLAQRHDMRGRRRECGHPKATGRPRHHIVPTLNRNKNTQY